MSWWAWASGSNGPLPPPFPPVPTRAAVCDVNSAFQGVTFHTQEYGDIPGFGLETSTLNDHDLLSYLEQVKQLGRTHVEFAVSWQYDEPSYSYPVPGRDFSNNLGELYRRMEMAIRHGLLVKLSLSMDGRSKQPDSHGNYPYNDPYGWTYGYEWGMANMERVIRTLQGDGTSTDLTPYTLFVPGYDAVFYGWGNNHDEPQTPDLQPQRLLDFATKFRQLLPGGHLGIEHDVGHIPPGEGTGYEPGQVMTLFDVILSEFDGNVHQDSTWQIVGRMVHPYNRPPDQPAGDDPNPPYLLGGGTPRGPWHYIRYEYNTYQWVRGEVTPAQVDANRQYLQALGPGRVC